MKLVSGDRVQCPNWSASLLCGASGTINLRWALKDARGGESARSDERGYGARRPGNGKGRFRARKCASLQDWWDEITAGLGGWIVVDAVEIAVEIKPERQAMPLRRRQRDVVMTGLEEAQQSRSAGANLTRD
jgi:hypothetical protein